MIVRDTLEGYGIVSRLFHWLMAVAIFAMFALGLWMVRLDYYSPYYNSAPEFHRSFGMLLLFALLVRWLWRATNPKPQIDDLTPLEQKASYAVHWGFYILLLAIMVSGYLITTLDGRPVDVFGWFSVPSIFRCVDSRIAPATCIASSLTRSSGSPSFIRLLHSSITSWTRARY